MHKSITLLLLLISGNLFAQHGTYSLYSPYDSTHSTLHLNYPAHDFPDAPADTIYIFIEEHSPPKFPRRYTLQEIDICVEDTIDGRAPHKIGKTGRIFVPQGETVPVSIGLLEKHLKNGHKGYLFLKTIYGLNRQNKLFRTNLESINYLEISLKQPDLQKSENK